MPRVFFSVQKEFMVQVDGTDDPEKVREAAEEAMLDRSISEGYMEFYETHLDMFDERPADFATQVYTCVDDGGDKGRS